MMMIFFFLGYRVIWSRSVLCSGRQFFQQCFLRCPDKKQIFLIQGYQDMIGSLCLFRSKGRICIMFVGSFQKILYMHRKKCYDEFKVPDCPEGRPVDRKESKKGYKKKRKTPRYPRNPLSAVRFVVKSAKVGTWSSSFLLLINHRAAAATALSVSLVSPPNLPTVTRSTLRA